jgi:hypothetical protein
MNSYTVRKVLSVVVIAGGDCWCRARDRRWRKSGGGQEGAGLRRRAGAVGWTCFGCVSRRLLVDKGKSFALMFCIPYLARAVLLSSLLLVRRLL